MKRALITGVTGQDGSYLSELLLEKGYEVHGVVRESSSFNRRRVESLYLNKDSKYLDRLKLHYGELTDSRSLSKVVKKTKPDEVYNLGAQSHVGLSFEIPEYNADVTAVGAVRLLDAVLDNKADARFYQASSSELFGKALEVPQTESTPFYPISPYACAKAYAFYVTRVYKEAYGMFACNGILFNHESPRRGENYVTRKITLSLARIKKDLQDKLYLGNLDACRDWGYSKDYVEAMWLMLQQDTPDDYVISTGETHTVREFAELAAKYAGFDIKWEGEGQNERGADKTTGKTIIEVSPKYFRPSDVDRVVGNYSKARKKLGWKPKTSFNELVEIMMEADLKYVENGSIL